MTNDVMGKLLNPPYWLTRGAEIVAKAAKQLSSTVQLEPLGANGQACIRANDMTTYCLVDNRDGTAHVLSGANVISDNIPIGYRPFIVAVGDNGDTAKLSVYTDLDGGSFPLQSEEISDLYRDKWKEIEKTPIPFDEDLFSHDGCHGTDWFCDDDPIEMVAANGGLHVDKYLITPQVVTFVDFGRFYISSDPADEKSHLRSLLDCARSQTTTRAEAIPIESAIALLNHAEPTLYVGNGPFQFAHADMDMAVDGGDVEIKSRRNGAGKVVALRVNLSPDGLGNNATIDINLLGMLMVYKEESNKYTSSAYVTMANLDADEKKLYRNLLVTAREKASSAQDKATISQVASLIENPIVPEWAHSTSD